MESTLKNMVLSLFVITLVSGSAVALTYRLTAGTIAQARVARTNATLLEVLPAFDNDPTSGTQTIDIDGIPTTVYTARMRGEVVGYAVETATNKGFRGEIAVLIGFGADKTVRDIRVLKHSESPGFGDKLDEPDNVLTGSFRGNDPGDMQLSLRRDGGDIDGISGSTVTSRAFIDAVARGYNALMLATGGEPVPDASSGATTASGATPGKSSGTASGSVGPAKDSTAKNRLPNAIPAAAETDSSSGATPATSPDASSGATAEPALEDVSSGTDPKSTDSSSGATPSPDQNQSTKGGGDE